MAVYILRRMLAIFPTALAVSLLVFLMIELVPGDPAAAMLGQEASRDQAEQIREQLGLNKPFSERIVSWYVNLVQGDLGESYFLRQPVTEAIIDRLPVTISMTLVALTISTVVGILAGILASIRRGTVLDWGIMLLAMVGVSIPIFWLALNMIFLFSVRLGWLPTGGYVPLRDDAREYVRHLLMPGIALGLAYMALIARITRSSMLEVLRQGYVQTARAKGLQERSVVMRHALRNALIPIITIIGLNTGYLLAGSVITETVFNMPGLGRLIVDAVQRRDYPVIQGGILVITMFYLVVNLLVDLIYAWVNPRIRFG